MREGEYVKDQVEGIKRSEGIKRIFRVLSVTFVLSWVIFVIIATDADLKGIGWIIVIVAIPIRISSLK